MDEREGESGWGERGGGGAASASGFIEFLPVAAGRKILIDNFTPAPSFPVIHFLSLVRDGS